MDIKKTKKQYINDLFENTFSRHPGRPKRDPLVGNDCDDFFMSDTDNDIVEGFRDNKRSSDEY
jgi:hypothetical protein